MGSIVTPSKLRNYSPYVCYLTTSNNHVRARRIFETLARVVWHLASTSNCIVIPLSLEIVNRLRRIDEGLKAEDAGSKLDPV